MKILDFNLIMENLQKDLEELNQLLQQCNRESNKIYLK